MCKYNIFDFFFSCEQYLNMEAHVWPIMTYDSVLPFACCNCERPFRRLFGVLSASSRDWTTNVKANGSLMLNVSPSLYSHNFPFSSLQIKAGSESSWIIVSSFLVNLHFLFKFFWWALISSCIGSGWCFMGLLLFPQLYIILQLVKTGL